MEGLIGLLALVVLAVPVLLVVALVSIGGLKARVSALEGQILALQSDAAGRLAALASRAPPPTWQSATAAPGEEVAADDEPTLDQLIRGARAGSPMGSAEPRSAGPGSAGPGSAEPDSAGPGSAGPAEPATPRPPPLPPLAPASTGRAIPARAADPGSLASSASAPARARPASSRPRPAPDPLGLAARALRRWFSEGNVPVKVGVLVLFAGVAALLKYASDAGWVSFPPPLRLAAVALAALAGLVFGWVQRERKRLFALSLQGGAIGVLLLVVFAAFKLFDPPLLPAAAAFAASVVLVAGCGVLAVRQHSITLAVLGILAGFLAPLWLSTGQGNHVALFGYYAVLNAGIFAIAWVRPWRALNLLGFVFTFGIGTAWGVLRYRPQDLATTEPFLLLFFAFYLLIPLLYARRRAAGRRDFVDGCLVFAAPLMAFTLQAGLLQGQRMPLALCALGLGAIYAALAWWLQRREHFAPLVAPYAILAVGFATLAVPLALSAQATACVFALEGAALVWLGLRQGQRLQQATGLLLQLGAAVALLVGATGSPVPLQAVANAGFMGALLIAVAGLASAWSYRRAGVATAATGCYLWGLAWWLGNGVHEIGRFVAAPRQPDVVLMLVVATAALAAQVQRRLPSPALLWTAVLGLVATLPLALVQDTAHAHPLVGLGGVAWLVVAAAGWWILRMLREEADAPAALAHVAWLLAWPLVLSLAVHATGQRLALGAGWRHAMLALPWLALAAAVQWRPRWVSAPLTERFDGWRAVVQMLLAAVLAIGWLNALWSAGDSAPLPWLPLLNPLELAQLAALAILAGWLGSPRVADELAQRRSLLLSLAGFTMVSVTVLRATHHWGGLAWDASLFSTSLVQTSLTVAWSVLGVLGWIIGSRRGQRGLWRAGAVLMAIVLAKLVLVDRQHLGSGLGIASFIAYGLLCTAVGYLAPAPPRPAASSLPAAEEATA